MEDLVLCYDSLSPDAINFARKVYESLLLTLQVQVREPNPNDKTSFTPSANNLAVIVTPGIGQNPLVAGTVEKAAQTKKTVIFVEDLLQGANGNKEIIEDLKLDEAILKKLGKPAVIPYVLECAQECNDQLFQQMKFSDPTEMQAGVDFRRRQVLDDILRFSAKVSKLRLQAQVKRRVDFCLTCANPAKSPAGETTVLALKSVFEQRAPALTVVCNRGDKTTAASSVRIQHVQECFNLVVVVTKGALEDPDLLEEVRAALESEVQITIVQHLEEVPDLDAIVKAEASFGGDDVLRSNLSRIIPFPYLSHLNEAVVRALVVPETVKCDELKTPRTRAAGIPTFRLGYKNLLSLDMPTDGRCPIYRHQKEFPNMKIPDEIETSIKNLWALYAKDDPDLKKEEQKPVDQRKIAWDAFVAVDRCVVETVGADYSEMVSRRVYSMMLYPGLTLDEKVSYQTFYNYYAYVAKKMGACSGDPDVQKHFKYVEDKVKFVQKSKRYQVKYDLFITHDRSKVANKLCVDVVNAIRTFTPNVRMAICSDKRIDPEAAAGGSLNVAVIVTPGCFGNEKVAAEVAAGQAAGAKMLIISDVGQSPNFIADLTTASDELKKAFARPAVVDFSSTCAMAAAMNVVDNLSFPDPDKSKPEGIKSSCLHRRENPVVSFMYKACTDENEYTAAQQALANCTSPSTLNAGAMRESFFRDGGCEVLANKFKELCSVASVAETGLRAIANVGMDNECAQRLAELDIIQNIVEVMNNHTDNAMIQGEACRAISTLAANEEARLRINQAKGFQKVLQTQKKWELEQDEDFRNCRFSYLRLNEGDQIMMNFPARKVWVSAVVMARNSNGTYDIECAHGSREEKVSAQWIRPRAPGDNVQEFTGVWAWKPQGKLTEDELVLKPDGMSQLRGTGSVGTWNPKDTKGKGRSMIKLQLGSTILDMERISVTMLISTTTSHRAVLLDKYDDCLQAQYWWFNHPVWLDSGIPNLLGRKADVKRLEQIIYNEPQKESQPWVGLPDKMDENFVAQWSGLLKIEQGGEYTFFISSEHHARLTIDDTQIINAEGVKALTESTAAVVLSPGERSIALTFVYKSGGSKACTLRYKGADTDGEKKVVPAAVLQNFGVKGETVPKPGIIAQYYRNDDFSGVPDIIRVEKQLDFESTTDPWENLPVRYGSSAWSARFACYLKLKCGGAKKAKYTFRLASGKKGKLYMGGALLSDDDEAKDLELEPGEHFIEVEYKTAGGSNQLQLFYSGPETSPGEDEEKNPLPGVEQTVPSTRTRHYVLPTCALPKGNPISVAAEGEGKASVVAVEWAFDDSFVVSADENGNIRLWKVEDGSPLGEKATVDGSLTCGTIGRKSMAFAVGMEDGGIQLFDLGSNGIQARGEKMVGHEGAVHSVGFNHDDTLLASVGMDGTTRIWDAKTQQEVTNPEDPLMAFKHVEEKKAGGKDPICGFKSKVENNPQVTQALQEVMTMTACSFSVDGKVLALGGDDKRVRLVLTEAKDFVRGPDIMVEIPPPEPDPDEEVPELEEGEEPPPPPEPEYEAVPGHPFFITGHNDTINCVSFAPIAYGSDEYHLATSSQDATIRLWVVKVAHRSESNEAYQLLSSPMQSLSKFVTWAPDGATLATATEGIFFQLWSGVSGKGRNDDGLAGHVSGLTGAAFSPYGQSVVSASEDGNLRMWHFMQNRSIVEIAKLEKKQMKLNTDIKSYEKNLAVVQKEFVDYEQGSLAYRTPVYDLRAALDDGKMRTDEYNGTEEELGLAVTDYYELDGMIEDFSSYFKLWDMVIKFQEMTKEWTSVPMHTVTASEVEGLLDGWFKQTILMIKDPPAKGGFESPHTSNAKKVAVALRDSIDLFRKKFPFIRAFSQPFILDRHWEELFKRIGQTPPCPFTELTADKMFELKVLDFEEDYEELSAAAQKENTLKKSLKSMKGDWVDICLDTAEYKDTGAHMLRGIDDVQAVLDDHIVKTQGIRSSPFCKPFEAEVHEWEAKLLYIQDFVDQTLLVQRTWCSLEPIFISDDIKRQLPTESAGFAEVDTMFRMRMKQVASDTHCLAIASIENVVEDMTAANNKLEIIQKGLKDYLETKRLYFPRFFFLNDTDLLSILAETKDPTLVQPHLGKAFEGIQSVRFDSTNAIIDAMKSPEGELVPWVRKCDVTTPENDGNVEKWLLELEEIVFDTLRERIYESNQDYAKKPRGDWCQEWPGQVVLGTDMIYWTNETKVALDETTEGKNAIADHAKHLHTQLTDIVALVRGELTKNARVAIGAMCTLDVHSRDVVDEFVDNQVDSAESFDFLCQLRYYWQMQGGFIRIDTGEPNDKMECQCAIVNSVLLYGFEYLGNSPRLVITPLTDRCYRTLMGAFALYYGGAPEGPAGTGKTESTKDLAKALAICCVVFNCSDSMDYQQLGKFFKGLASCGSWCCFDEFNRISLEVLSVVAQQIQQISLAIKQKMKRFVFEGVEIQLIATCAVNITMNPGYAGRSELPDNLKALFRPVAMMVPSYALIAEIRLYSFGYVDAKRIGLKGTQALKLSSEQLSPQRHYDFGMRGLNALLVAGGNGKRKYGDDYPEDVVALRSFMDVNMPKFTSPDIPLFKGIIGDLFPGVESLASDYGKMTEEMVKITKNFGLQPTEPFLYKTIQLWETVMVRHGLMTVGIPPCGKTMVKDVLAETLAAVADGGDVFMPVTQYVMNPKSIEQGQLYGEADLNTQEWTDGVLAIAVRNAAKSFGDGRRQWVVLDGPVDAIWIENMNTVLDDNKKLCLNSGEIIKLSACTTMFFEVRDLDYASPATVSRVGVVFIEPDNDLGWKPIVQSWVNTLPDFVMADHKEQILDLFMGSFACFQEVAMHKCSTPVQVGNNWLAMMATRLMKSLIVDKSEKFIRPNPKNDDDEDGQTFDDREIMIIQLYLFSCIWTTGACSNGAGRDLFNDILKGVVEKRKDIFQKYDVVSEWTEIAVTGQGQIPGLPRGQPLHDFYVNIEDGGKWTPWTERIAAPDIPKDMPFHEIIVETTDTCRNQFLLRTLVESNYHVLISGPTGTAKTASINGMLLGGFSPDNYSTIAFAFSAKTTANQTQDIIDGKLDKRKKGTFGPPINKKMLVFIDDLNMPAKEEYGAQPPIEILRQSFVKTPLGFGWYDRKGWEFRNLVDMIYLTAMGPPGAGKNDITDRYSAMFNLIFVTPFDDESLGRIFSTSCSKFFAAMARDVAAQVPNVVQATLDVYNLVSKELLPTPAKSHYTFNMRDVSKVFQGICICTRESLPKIDDLVRCWVHENERVFKDRLTNKPDQNWFTNKCKSLMDKHFKRTQDQVMRPVPEGTPGGGFQELFFCDFVDPKTTCYQEVAVLENLSVKMAECLDDFNAVSKVRMDLVLFQTFIGHVCRVIRVLRLPLGNALLVGVGGSGRKSVTTLAASVAQYNLFMIEVNKGYGMNEWHDDMRRLLMSSGMKQEIQVFLFPDTQIQDETFLEEVSSILNTGEVPNLYGNEERMEIMEKCSKPANALGKYSANEVFGFYVGMCRKNTHIVLAMSPIGAAFRNRLRAFPSLVNCCTIDWFMDWPADALTSVAMQFLSKLEMEEKVMKNVVKIMVDCQLVVTELTDKYRTEAKRHFYVTPSSYLELINSFTSMLNQQRKFVSQAKWRYDVGLEKIADAATQVAALQKDLEDLQPVLEVKAKECSEIMARVETEKAGAEEKQIVVDEEARAANACAEEASVIKADCTKDLEAAMPALEDAVKALNSLSKGDIGEVKAMKTPPAGVVMVAKAMCFMFQVKPIKVAAPDGKGKVDDYWEPCKKELLGRGNLLNDMVEYDKDNIDASTITKVQPMYDDPDFEPDKIKKASIAAMGICKWIRAMVVYDKVAKEVGPKRAKLAEAEATASAALALVAEKKEELAAVIKMVNELEELQTSKTNEMNDLQKMRDDCSAKLVRAEKLITGLGGEKVSWTAKSKKLSVDYNNLTGDILIAAGIMAYLGVFTAQYRIAATSKWVERLTALNIPARKVFSLQDVIGDMVKVRQWVIDKLPNDALSIDNAIILDNSRRWPLMIDPQQQANKWVRTTWKDKLRIFRLTQKYGRGLEMAISMGNPTLFENVQEALDSMLDPVLLRSTFKQGPVEMIRLGDSVVEWSKDFRMYITTKLANPHYPPEVCVMCGLLNFMATLDGLQDQQLGILVAMEEPEVEQKRIQLVLDSAAAKAQLKEIEDRILALLSASTGNILEDQELIETLANSKTTSLKIEEQVQQQERTGAQIAETRAVYRPLAIRSACLFFIIGELSIIDPMYQFSLDWYILQFATAITRAEAADSRDERFENLFDSYLTLLYDLVCMSLFAAHKLLYSLLLTFKVQEIDKELDSPAMLAFLTGLPGTHPEEKPPDSEWLTDVSWSRLKNLQKLGNAFDGFIEEFKAQINGWQAIFDSETPLEDDWPNNFKMKCKPLDRALVMFALRTDQTVNAIMGIVDDKLGRKFLEVPPFDLPKAFRESTPWIPIVFILSSGSDPMADVQKLAESITHTDGSTMMSKINPISLGQGQGPKAVAGIKEGTKLGKWVLLQNCHLATSWMNTLETLVEGLSHNIVDEPQSEEEVHGWFRLWLTACPSPTFPISTLQTSIKMTVEPPKGLRSALQRSYLSFEEDWFESCTRPKEFKKLLFGLCFFHALILERRKFGAIGWNVAYGFSEPDRDISRRQLRQFLDEFSEIPWAALQYMVAEANYGGRVTDGQDRRAIVQILEDFYTPKILEEDYKFSISGIYYAPQNGPLSSYLDYISTLPLAQNPEVFWLHSNANLTAAINEGVGILKNAISMIAAFGGGGGDDEEEGASKAKPKSNEEIFCEVAAELESRMPNPVDLLVVERSYPVRYDECLNTVLLMELGKMNRLLVKLNGTIKNVQLAVKGFVVFSPELEDVGNCFLANKVPSSWMGVSYPCLKPMQSYIQDHLDRWVFFKGWINDGMPNVFWFSAYFFQQAFLTGVMQNFARREHIAIDRCLFNFAVCRLADSNPTEPPESGAYMNGLFMDGARWDDDAQVIVDSFPKVLWAKMPNYLIQPVEITNDRQTERAKFNSGSRDHVYPAPIYKESLRKGVLSTSGHSSNFIMWLYMPIAKQDSEQLWTKRGVALITMTDD